ncbi:MAG: phosphoribosyltransferase [Planctomycetes bacterium]|nr:phosphoribosyltransferase [Planctomycetota bacterium]
MSFINRLDAAEQLVARLYEYRGHKPLILAIPRGAVPMGAVIAEALDGDLDVVLVRKLGAPFEPELAIGAVTESGEVILNLDPSQVEISDTYIEEEVREQLATLHDRRRRYTPEAPAINPAGRIVIVVDDGIATGSTMLAALRTIRARRPSRLIVAVGVAPVDTVRRMAQHADEVVCLEVPEDFRAVGNYYDDFSEVTDEDVVRVLRQARTVSKRERL